MKFPVKLNRAHWPNTLAKCLPSATDPRVLCDCRANGSNFASAVSTFKFGSTFKTTCKSRFPLTIAELAQLKFQPHPTILDVGASDGSTSLDVMQALQFEKYYVTDLHIEVFYKVTDDATWFFDEVGTCILMVTNKWVVYPEIEGAIFPFNRISEVIFSHAPNVDNNIKKVLLVNPGVRGHDKSKIVIRKHNIQETWRLEKADLIIAANILNRVYFTANEIQRALKELSSALNENGRIVVIDNRSAEKSTIFQFSEGIVKVEKRINGGTEIENLAMKSFGTNKAAMPVARAM